MSSRFLNEKEMKGFLKTCDILLPGVEGLPRFSHTGFNAYLDDVLEEAPESDVKDLKMLFGIFSWLPSLFIRFILVLSEKSEIGPAFWQTNMRLINIGLKGIIFSLYYSRLPDHQNHGAQIFEQIGYRTQIPGLLEEEVKEMKCDDMMEVARVAQVEINRISLSQRIELIHKMKKNILKNKEHFVEKIHFETKKTHTDILTSEIFATIDFLNYLEKNAKKELATRKVTTPIALMGKKSSVRLEPLGTMLVISPWNYPFFQSVVPAALSFICGNATIIKPSEYTPMKGVIEDLFNQAGFSSKWVQIAYGDGTVGKELIDLRPDKVFFTGSVKTGQKIMAQASELLIPVELELGGKDPMIVFEDTNLHRATSGALWGALTASGQACTSVEKILVHENIYEDFKTLLVQKALKVNAGEGKDSMFEIGPMTTNFQVQKVREHLEDAIEKGATLLTGESWDRESKLIPPLVIAGVNETMEIYKEETFGPILPLIPFKDEAQAVYMANDSDYGLTASVWSKDMKRAYRVANALKVGGVSINNVMLTEGNPHLPFGGVKNSGFGRFKGKEGFHSFSNTKSIIANTDTHHVEPHWYPFTKQKYQLFDKMTSGLFGKGPLSFIKFVIFGLKLEGHANKISKQS